MFFEYSSYLSQYERDWIKFVDVSTNSSPGVYLYVSRPVSTNIRYYNNLDRNSYFLGIQRDRYPF